MDELIETFSEKGEPTGLVARDIVHRRGLWHRASNVFLFRGDGQLVVQRRSQAKDVWPGAWDLSVAEHLTPGESFEAGAIRGLGEELGITGVSLRPVSDVIRSRLEVAEHGIKDFEFQVSFLGVSDAEFRLQLSEVEEVRLYQLVDLRAEMLNHPERFTPWFRSRARDIRLFG